MRPVTLTLLLIGGTCEDPPAPEPPSTDWTADVIQDVQVLPTSVSALAPSAFDLRVQFTDKTTGYVLAPSSLVTPHWTSASGTVTLTSLTGGAPDGYAVRVQIAAGASGTATIQVDADGHTGSAVVTIVPASTPATKDLVKDDRAAPTSLPSVALAEAASSGGACPEYVVAPYVRQALLGSLEQTTECPGPGEASVYAVAQRMYFAKHTWSSAAEAVQLPPSGTTVQTPDVVDIAVRLAVTPAAGFSVVEPAFDVALEHANAVFDSNRVGLRFSVVGAVTDARSDLGTLNWVPNVVVVLPTFTCPTITPATLVGPQQLTVFVVDDIAENGSGGFRGFTCPVSSTQGQVVFVAFDAMGEILAHELGHTLLGMDHPSFGAGFPSNDLMVIVSPSATAAPWGHLTVGQVFRALRSQTSWWNVPSAHPDTRDCATSCPKLVLDYPY